jgi:hypothetical protein
MYVYTYIYIYIHTYINIQIYVAVYIHIYTHTRHDLNPSHMHGVYPYIHTYQARSQKHRNTINNQKFIKKQICCQGCI